MRFARHPVLVLAALALLGTLTPVAAAVSEDSGAESAAAAAREDASVAAVLDGTGATVVKTTAWGGTQDQPAGYRVEYGWPATAAVDVDGVWPLLRSDANLPRAPYDSADYRIRATHVTGLQVDVLVDGERVIQIMPADGETRYVLKEQTWPPFSEMPWLTLRPWALAPLFVAIAAVLMVRAWLRSRAWNRRLPSMTRHDRQFIARVAVLVFLLAGFAWQVYEAWYSATGPSVQSDNGSNGVLETLPLLLIPPALFIAALVLELAAAPRRGSWALLAVLCAAGSVYFLVAAILGTVTNLNLTFFILLAVLALIAVPRAFSAGKMGWSRSAPPGFR